MPSTGRTAGRYFVSAGVDAFVIGGLSIATWVVFRLIPSSATASQWGTILTISVWTVSNPHFVATSARLYGSAASRGQYPLTASVTPMIFLAAVVASFASPAVVAPAFVKFYQLWSPYHFSGQTLGLTMLYARRSGITIDRTVRRAFIAFIYSTFLYSAARLDVGVAGGQFFGVHYPGLNLPSWLPTVFAVAVWTSIAVLAGLLLQRRRAVALVLPWIVFVPALTQCVWFATKPIPTYRNLVFFFHSLQYLYVAWNWQLRQRLDVGDGRPSVPFVWRESVRWVAMNVAGAYALFWFLPRVGAHFGRPLAFSTAVILVALQTHHFFVDGVIWRLRNPGVRSPLSSSIAEVSGRAAPPWPAPT